MITQAIFADRAFTPYEEVAGPVILVEGEKIAAIGPHDRVQVPSNALRRPAKGLTVVPGFVDLHIHGAGGHDAMEGTSEALNAICTAVACCGTTALLTTTVTASEESTCRAVAVCAAHMRTQMRAQMQSVRPHAGSALGEPRPDNPPYASPPQAEILGVHLEGPFISPERRGVHPPEWIVPPSVPLLDRILAAGAASTVRILTLAPELPGALDLVEVARAKGIVVSLGHTDATYEQAMRAIERGASHAAHVFNAMRPFLHRETGVLGAVLTAPTVNAELIADGVHVDAAAIRLLLAAKGTRGIVLVSDGIAATGMPDGTYRLGNFEVTVSQGIPRGADGKLAGSTLTLDRALRNVVALGVPFTEALAMLTANPARALGLERRKGHLIAGADADLVFLDSDNRVATVMTRGIGGPNP